MNAQFQSESKSRTPSAPLPAPHPLLQRKCACGGRAEKGGECQECRSKRLQRRAANGTVPTTVPPIVKEVLHSPGQPLDPGTQTLMESRFGHDFSNVRVHTDTKAAESAQAVSALAYTVGRDVVFGPGQFAPATGLGTKLLMHELTHVAQQSESGIVNLSNLRLGPTENACERQAETYANTPNDNNARTLQNPGDTAIVQRVPLPELQEVQGISTPQPVNAQRGRDRSTNFQLQSVNVIFLPDRRSRARDMANRAETSFRINGYNINYREQNGNVISFTGPGAVRVTIQTTYGPGVSGASRSGYGRGTTTEDRTAGQTSLEFHEGSHGVDFMQFLQDNPLPQFTGTIGMSIDEFRGAMNAYGEARTQYQQRMDEFSSRRTDCVGTTIDEFNEANGLRTTICEQSPAIAD